MESKLKHLWASSLLLSEASGSSSKDIQALRCHYRLLSMAQGRKIANLPASNFGPEAMCKTCLSRWSDGNFSIIQRKFRHGESLQRLLQSPKPLSPYQQQLVNLATSEMDGAIYHHCNVCKESVTLKYRKLKSEEEPLEQEISSEIKKKKKRKSDKFAGLKASLVLKAQTKTKKSLLKRTNPESGWGIDSSPNVSVSSFGSPSINLENASDSETNDKTKEKTPADTPQGTHDPTRLTPEILGFQIHKRKKKKSSQAQSQLVLAPPRVFEPSPVITQQKLKKKKKKSSQAQSPLVLAPSPRALEPSPVITQQNLKKKKKRVSQAQSSPVLAPPSEKISKPPSNSGSPLITKHRQKKKKKSGSTGEIGSNEPLKKKPSLVSEFLEAL